MKTEDGAVGRRHSTPRRDGHGPSGGEDTCAPPLVFPNELTLSIERSPRRRIAQRWCRLLTVQVAQRAALDEREQLQKCTARRLLDPLVLALSESEVTAQESKGSDFAVHLYAYVRSPRLIMAYDPHSCTLMPRMAITQHNSSSERDRQREKTVVAVA